jgi:hypothetical protein
MPCVRVETEAGHLPNKARIFVAFASHVTCEHSRRSNRHINKTVIQSALTTSKHWKYIRTTMTAFDTYRNHSILSNLEMSVCKFVMTVTHIHRNVPSKFICYSYYDVRVRRACVRSQVLFAFWKCLTISNSLNAARCFSAFPSRKLC